jgi:D-3-phosphoglycerate dehydrogenase
MEPDFISQESNLAHNLGFDYCQGLDALDRPYSDTILITNTHTNVLSLPKELLDQVKLLIHPNSGHDNLPYEWVQEQKFPIILGNEIRAHAVSNTILSHLFNHFSSIHHQDSWSDGRKYNRKLLSELTVHLIGHGHIGKILESSLTALVKKIYITDQNQILMSKGNNDEVRSDVIIPVPSLTKSSRYIIDKAFLQRQSEDFCLINCSRGEIVNTKDLLSILQQRNNAYAYLDVFEQEPIDFNQFLTYPNLKTTSHIAGVFTNIARDTINFEKKIINSFFKLTKSNFEEEYKTSLLNIKTQREFP